MATAATATTAPTLDSLPNALIALILEHLVASSGGSAKWAARLGLTSRRMSEAVAAADSLWRLQCQALGWSLDWLSALPPGTNAYDYFRARLSARHRLRGWLRRMRTFLDPASAAALRRTGASVARLQAAEATLGHPLPWDLFELLRWADGQERAAAGRAAQALNGARLLGLSEVVATAQDLAAALPAGGGGSGAGSAGGGEQQPLAGGLAGVRLGEGRDAGAGKQPHGPLLPLTDASRGGRQFVVDLRSRVWLRSGFNTLPAADSLAAFVQRCLT